MLLPSAFTAGLILLALVVPRQQTPELFRAFVGAGGLLFAWSAVLFLTARLARRELTIEIAVHRHHWVQACAQMSVFLYWGWHARFVYAYLPLILAQLLFAYAFDSLLSWSRRKAYVLGFGPLPIVFSINLFLWFRPEFFHWQFAMVAMGYLAKEFIRWEKGGRSAHIFNPSSFPLALVATVLILTASSDATLVRQIVTSQFHVPHLYLVIFLAALPGQLLFGVARMTMAAVVTLYLVSLAYFQFTGTYLFLDAHIPVPVFLGMHLLFTDPATSPRAGSGRVAFGVLYALGVAGSFVLLSWAGAPTAFDKLLPLPFLNLLVRRIDGLVAASPLAAKEPKAPGRTGIRRRHLVYTTLWAATFLGLSALRGIGHRHPGQYLPFWSEACVEGSERACSYLEYRQSVYCSLGSGWACNEWGIRLAEDAQPADRVFRRGCELGFTPACRNPDRLASGEGAPVHAPPELRDLPIVLSWKGTVEEREPARLYAMACEQGWPDVCDRLAAAGIR